MGAAILGAKTEKDRQGTNPPPFLILPLTVQKAEKGKKYRLVFFRLVSAKQDKNIINEKGKFESVKGD